MIGWASGVHLLRYYEKTIECGWEWGWVTVVIWRKNSAELVNGWDRLNHFKMAAGMKCVRSHTGLNLVKPAYFFSFVLHRPTFNIKMVDNLRTSMYEYFWWTKLLSQTNGTNGVWYCKIILIASELVIKYQPEVFLLTPDC